MATLNAQTFRSRGNWYAALATEAAAPALRLYARLRTGSPSPPTQWRKALLVGAHHIGDLLYRSASLDRLKAGLPRCDFSFLAAPGAAEILQGHPALAEVLPWLRSDSTLDLAPERLQELVAKKFDAAICYNSGKYWPDLRLALRLGIPNRAAYTHKGFSGWVTHPVPLRYPQPFPAYFRDLVAALTGETPDWPLRPIVYPGAEAEAEASRLWERLRLDRPAGVVACFMTSRQPAGLWPAPYFGRALQRLRERLGVHILLCGAETDGPLLREIDAQFSLQADLMAGALSLRAVPCLLRRCRAVLTTDSGPRHMANAAGIPVFFIRNVSFHPIEAGSYVETERDLCPETAEVPPDRYEAVLAGISPENVAEIMTAALTPR